MMEPRTIEEWRVDLFIAKQRDDPNNLFTWERWLETEVIRLRQELDAVTSQLIIHGLDR